ncbi:uncharacterized protein LOC133791345 [Humulus lupulus]|uniref:uncharacterized protein LOC133791345 n=1 Tax=Humulus lupulus TaxID=3486 RepID=UPI002B41385F|nr:uncharacterized protein LOC133791345 [Humulus lupulus]
MPTATLKKNQTLNIQFFPPLFFFPFPSSLFLSFSLFPSFSLFSFLVHVRLLLPATVDAEVHKPPARVSSIYPLGVKRRGIFINGQFLGPQFESVTNANLIVSVFNALDEPFLISWDDFRKKLMTVNSYFGKTIDDESEYKDKKKKDMLFDNEFNVLFYL